MIRNIHRLLIVLVAAAIHVPAARAEAAAKEPLKGKAEAYIHDPGAVLGKTAYVVPKMRMLKSLSNRYTFPSQKYFLMREQQPVDLNLELPEAVICAQVMMGDARAKLARTETVQRSGKRLVKTIWQLRHTHRDRPNNTHLFMDTTLSVGQKATGYYYLSWPGGAQPPQTLDFECIDIPPVPRLRRFVVGTYGLRPVQANSWFPNFPKDFLHVGFNTISIPMSYFGWEVLSGRRKEITPEQKWSTDASGSIIRKAREAGVFMRWGDYFFPPARNVVVWKSWMKDPSARAIGIDGKEVPYRGGGPLLCPSYRGKLYQESVNWVRDSGMIERYGINWFAFDLEIYATEGSKICFCDRCLKGFEAYRKKHHPDLPALGPKVFMRSPEKYPDLHTAWIDFKCFMFADMFAEMKRRWAPVVKKAGAKSCPWDGIVFSDWGGCWLTYQNESEKRLRNHTDADVFNIGEPGLYCPPGVAAAALFNADVEALRYHGKKRLLGTPTAMNYKGVALKPKWLKYTILECAAAGSLGVYIFPWNCFDGLKVKYMADALRIIQPVEDIVVEGTRIPFVTCYQRGWKVHGVERGREAVIIVSAYDTEEGKEVKDSVTYLVDSPRRVIDLATMKQIGKMTPAYPSFHVTLKEDRARLFYVGNRNLSASSPAKP